MPWSPPGAAPRASSRRAAASRKAASPHDGSRTWSPGSRMAQSARCVQSTGGVKNAPRALRCPGLSKEVRAMRVTSAKIQPPAAGSMLDTRRPPTRHRRLGSQLSVALSEPLHRNGGSPTARLDIRRNPPTTRQAGDQRAGRWMTSQMQASSQSTGSRDLPASAIAESSARIADRLTSRSSISRRR